MAATSPHHRQQDNSRQLFVTSEQRGMEDWQQATDSCRSHLAEAGNTKYKSALLAVQQQQVNWAVPQGQQQDHMLLQA